MVKETDLMTVPQVAEKLGINRKAVYKAIKDGRIGFIKIGNTYLLNAKAVEEYKVSQRHKAAGEAKRKQNG